jgi:cytochrome c oxidase subunit IV
MCCLKYYAFMHMVWAKVIVHLVTPILPPSLLYYAFMHMVAYADDEYSDDIFLLGEIFCGIDLFLL